MATEKRIAFGTILEMDPANGSTFAKVSMIGEITPPPRERAQTQALALEDTLDVPVPGIENQSDITFTQWWTRGDTDHELLDTQFDSGDLAAFRITYPYEEPATFNPTEEFSARVTGLEPATVGVNDVFQRTVTLTRATAVAKSSITVSVSALNEPPV